MSRTAGRLGWVLVWAVVFCNVGTSVYYVPGLLQRFVGDDAGFYVAALMGAFVLYAVKEVEAARRFPGGGGVVSVADRALGPWWACFAGQLLLVDFFLTVAISAASGLHHLAVVLPLGDARFPATVAGLGLLAVLNIIGVKESARAALVLAAGALLVDIVLIAGGLLVPAAGAGALPPPAPVVAAQPLAGFATAWLALAGLESLSQLAPAMRDLGATPRRGMIALVGSVLLTAPLLTLLATSGQTAGVAPDHLVAELGGRVAGRFGEILVGVAAAGLLFVAANTAVVGTWQVSEALTSRGFLPESLGALSRRFQTPTRAILLGASMPALVLLTTGGSLPSLGALYAFGLLGALLVGSVAIDLLRWREGDRGVGFWLGALLSVATLAGFVANVVVHPGAALAGAGMVVVGMGIGVATRRGWFERLAERLPGLRPPEVVRRADVPFFTVAQARALVDAAGPAGILVASRGAAPKLFREAVDRALSRGTTRIFLLYVDEVPGLFYPQLASPTPEGLTVLDAGCAVLRSLGADPVPVWAISHSAAGTVAEVVEACNCDTVVVGATQRTFLWHALRGRFVQDLLRQLPAEIRLIVVG